MRSRCGRSRRRRRRATRGSLRARDRAGRDPAEEGRAEASSITDEFIRPDTTRRDAREAQAGVSHRRQGLGDGGQFVGAQRRRRGAADRVGRGRRRSSARSRWRASSRRRWPASSRASWAWARCRRRGRRSSSAGLTLDRDGRDRAERSVRRAVARVPARARHRRRRSARESERRRDRARPSARHVAARGCCSRRRASSSSTGERYALCTMCIGVGQGMATIIERV